MAFLLPLLATGAAVGGVNAAANGVSKTLGKLPLIGPLVSTVANGVSQVAGNSMHTLFK